MDASWASFQMLSASPPSYLNHYRAASTLQKSTSFMQVQPGSILSPVPQFLFVQTALFTDAQPKNLGVIACTRGSLINGDGSQGMNVSLFLSIEKIPRSFSCGSLNCPMISSNRLPEAVASMTYGFSSCPASLFLTLTPTPWVPIKNFHSSLCFRLCFLGKAD